MGRIHFSSINRMDANKSDRRKAQGKGISLSLLVSIGLSCMVVYSMHSYLVPHKSKFMSQSNTGLVGRQLAAASPVEENSSSYDAGLSGSNPAADGAGKALKEDTADIAAPSVVGIIRPQQPLIRRNAKNIFVSKEGEERREFDFAQAKNGEEEFSHTVEDEEVEIPGFVYAGEITVVIILSLLFEWAQEKAMEAAAEHKKSSARDIMDCLFKELTILGFVGLLVYITTKSGGAKALAALIFPTWDGEGENPLAESFELIHMVIFCVMMVFIAQAISVLVLSNNLTSSWDQWEHVPSEGEHLSLLYYFQKNGYLDGKGKKLKNYVVPGTLYRMFIQDDLHGLLQWRSLRHEFLFPNPDNSHDGWEEVVQISEPGSFDFESYLARQLGKSVMELVEVDLITWFAALIMINPLVYLGSCVPLDWIFTGECIISWALFIIIAFILWDVTRVVHWLTPKLPENPEHIMEFFKGTDILKLRQANSSSNLKQNEEADKHAPLLEKKYITVAPLYSEKGTLPKRLRFKIPFLRDPNPVPNPHHRILFGQDIGIRIYEGLLEMLMFFQAVLIAALISVHFSIPMENMSRLDFVVVALTWAEWPLMLFYLLPRVISKLCIIKSVEFEKDPELIQEVIYEVKLERIQEALQILKLVKLQGRAQRLGGDTISDEEYRKALETFKNLDSDKKSKVETSFHLFDADNSGTIDHQELYLVLKSMGIAENCDTSLTSKSLITLCDRDHSGSLSLEEFKVLLMLALEKKSKEEEAADIAIFFRQIDTDRSGSLSIKEIYRHFQSMGCGLDEEFIGDLIRKNFGVVKFELNEAEFISWLQFLEEGG